MSRSCKDVTNREISRATIKLLDSAEFNLGDWTIFKILQHISKKFKCDLGDRKSTEYQRFKERVKIAVDFFNNRDNDSDDWEAFKKKYKKTTKSSPPKKRSPSPPKVSPKKKAKTPPKVSPKKKVKTPPKVSPKKKVKTPPKAVDTKKVFSFPKLRTKQSDISSLSQQSNISPEEFSGLSTSEIQALAQMCIDGSTLKKHIHPALSAKGITKLHGKSIYSYTKADLCDILLKSSPSKPVVPRTKQIDLDHCDSRQNTRVDLLNYINSQGWPTPTGKDAKTKDTICKYITSRSGGVRTFPSAPLSPIIPTSSDEIEDLDKCDSSRKLTIGKIQSIAEVNGWNKRDDYPKPKDKKASWCAWIRARLKEKKGVSHKAIEPSLPAPVITSCSQKDKWEGLIDAENDLNCPSGQICNTEIIRCTPSKGLAITSQPGMSQMDIPLRDGKSVTVYGKPDNLESLKARVAKLRPLLLSPVTKRVVSATCGTRSAGTVDELLNDLKCIDKNQVCDLASKKCTDLTAIGPGLTKFNFKGREIVGTKEDIASLEQRLGIEKILPPAPSLSAPFVSPGLTAPVSTIQRPSADKAMLALKKNRIVYGAEQIAEQEEAERYLAGIGGAPIKPAPLSTKPSLSPTIVSKPDIDKILPQQKKNDKKQTPPSILPALLSAPISQREPSNVSKLVSRLKDIQLQKVTTPVKLMSAAEGIGASISLCTGIQS